MATPRFLAAPNKKRAVGGQPHGALAAVAIMTMAAQWQFKTPAWYLG
ncbi:MAG: hypothetical protein ABW069_00635 [Duganella sp.]